MEKSTFGLKPDQLARLLGVAREPTPGETAEGGPGELVRELLARPLSIDPAAPDSLPALLARRCDALAGIEGQQISELLARENTPIAFLKALKDYAKALARDDATSGAGRAAATAVYYAAIAAAVIRHHRRITRHSNATLEGGFKNLRDKPWMPPELRDLFEQARVACRTRGVAD